MTNQVNEFLAQPNIGTGSKVWTSDNSLFSFWIGAHFVIFALACEYHGTEADGSIGINDIGNSYYESGDRDA